VLRKFLFVFTTICFLFSVSCGTILKPHQANKPHSGQLDVTIVLLDSIGLLFLIFPGIIAFTLDYSNGTLYLPRAKK
jgi:hypothetical protein